MGAEIFYILKRFFIIAIIQIFILKYIDIGWDGEIYIKLFIYPLFVLLIPINIPRTVIILLAFGFGLMLDMFYDSPGLHSMAFVFIAWLRKIVLQLMEPTEGYKIDSSLTIRNFGFNWFFSYSAILVFVNVFIYFLFEAFAFQYIPEVLIKSVLSFVVSEMIIIFYMLILNPK
jgi:hypothetical protein